MFLYLYTFRVIQLLVFYYDLIVFLSVTNAVQFDTFDSSVEMTLNLFLYLKVLTPNFFVVM